LEVRHRTGHTLLSLSGCEVLDEHNSRTLGNEFSALDEELVCSPLKLDLQGIRYVTSTALGALVAFNRRVRLAGGTLALSNVGPFVREVLALTRLDLVLNVQPGTAEAAAATA
jgi:anti-sigma B factor antagonist